MTHQLIHHPAQPALLCNVRGITAPVKNSLCCEAAGITHAIRATAGVLIPHVKLREAVHVDATLNAQNRPPAQLVVGYKRLNNAWKGR